MKGNDEVLANLNEVLTGELTAINQYFVHAKMCDNWGYQRIASHTRDESIDEMKHAERIVERILFLDGVPNLQRLSPLKVGESVVEQFRNDLAVEIAALERLHRGIALAIEKTDVGTPRDARRHPRRRGGARRLVGDAARDDRPDRRRALPRAAAARLITSARPGRDNAKWGHRGRIRHAQRRAADLRRGAADAARAVDPRERPAHRHEHRVRHLVVRRVHRASRR